MNTVFLEPLDVLFFRGNKLFGDPGSFGESLVPPWPSVAAGAIRSRMLTDHSIDLVDFAQGKAQHAELGTPAKPGPFAITAFQLARRVSNGSIELLYSLPADLSISQNKEGGLNVRLLAPTAVGKIASSAPFALLPVLAEVCRSKPASGWWLNEAGWLTYLSGQTPTASELIPAATLWAIDARVGVGLDRHQRRAADGRLFTVQAVALRPGVGFVAAIDGAMLTAGSSLRLGGDGRAATIHRIDKRLPEPSYADLTRAGRCRLVLTTPGLFSRGWLPTGAQPDNRRADGAIRFELHGVTGWIVCAAVPRMEIISGWDLARWAPKPAERAAPTGSVYWLDQLQATPEALRKLVERGLWSDPCEDAARRAEGFNRFTFAAY